MIYSDDWRPCFQLANNGAHIHLTVNYSINFLDLATGVHTQNIENTWRRAKHKHKKQVDFLRPFLNTNPQEFMWRQEFGDGPFTNLVMQIASVYPI